MNLYLRCSNCSKNGHNYSMCKNPISSYGIIAYRYNEYKKIEYLMIFRRDTIGFIDFIRGKHQNLLNLFKQMTINEKIKILQNIKNFDVLWNKLWNNNTSSKYKLEYIFAKKKFDKLTNIEDIINESMKYEQYETPEAGFPKGRKNSNENEFNCAIREFEEETGYLQSDLCFITNIYPVVELFMGSNLKSYLHKYFLGEIMYDATPTNRFQETEVSTIGWFSFDDCINKIRPYNLEKRKILENINNTLLYFEIL
jgi:hypothetical protein